MYIRCVVHTGTFMSVAEIKSAKIITDSYRTKVSFSLPKTAARASSAVTSKKIHNSPIQTQSNNINNIKKVRRRSLSYGSWEVIN